MLLQINLTLKTPLRLTLSIVALSFFAACDRSPTATKSPATEPPAATLNKIEPLSSSIVDGKADPVWTGLERHRIQLRQKLLLVKGSRGIVACPYLNINTFKKEVCAIVPAADFDGMLTSKVTAVSPPAEALGITIGMSGREALDRIR